MSDNSMILSSYNQLLEELIKLYPDETDNITSILIMEDDIKLQSIELFTEMLNDDEIFELFRKRKIKVFSSKTEKTKSLSGSLFGTSLTLKNIFNNQLFEIKNVLWTYLQLIVITKLLENKEENRDRINLLEEEIKNSSQPKNVPETPPQRNNNPVKNPLDLDVNQDTSNMINDIISNFENRLGQGKGNPLESVMEITEMINNKYQEKINNGDIEIEKLLENVTGSVPGLDKMMAQMGSTKPKETVVIDENFTTDDVKVENNDNEGPNMASMMNMFNKLSNMTDDNGDLDINTLMKQLSKDANMTDEQVEQMEKMVSMVDNMDLKEDMVEVEVLDKPVNDIPAELNQAD